MCPLFRLGNRITRKIVPLFLALILVSCAAPTSPSSNRTPTSVTTSPIVAQKVKSATEAGVFIRSVEGFQCPLRNPYTGYDANYSSQRLVLAEERLVYSQSEIQQMRAFLKNMTKKQPPTLRVVQGGSKCTIHLQMTNITSGGVQINLVGVQVIGKPHPNNYQYRAIETCSITEDCVAASGPGPCSTFGATLNLSPDMATSAMAKPINLQAGAAFVCTKLYQQPKDVVDFILSLTSTKPYIYSVVFILSVTNSKGSSIFTIPSMASTLAIITSAQISCFKLQGMQFVQEELNPTYQEMNCNFPDTFP